MPKNPGDLNVVQRFILECPQSKVQYLRHALEQMPFVKIVRTPMAGPINQLEAWIRQRADKYNTWTFLSAKDVMRLWHQSGGREVSLAAMSSAISQSGLRRYPDVYYRGKLYRLWLWRNVLLDESLAMLPEDVAETYLQELHEEPIHG